MEKNLFKIVFRLVCAGIFILTNVAPISGKDFTVVIDAGHGGHDPGAIGKISKEKNINLNVALQLGKNIQKNCKDVKVIYTRKTDVFIPLNRRAEIANEAKADLFISIHTNSVAQGKIVRGAETFTLGLARSEANLEIAKRENSVILIEDDYKQRYAGFNPNSSESYIMFEFIQDKHMEQSVKLAKLVQGQFRNHAKRIDRGVHQAGFLVLRATTMPSVLVELGYISTPDEERYLNSQEGINKLAEGIYRAFLKYKEEHEKPILAAAGKYSDKSVNTEAAPESNEPVIASNAKQTGIKTVESASASTTNSKPVFKIQILTSSKPLKSNDKELKGLSPVNYYKENGIYKYTYGESTDYNKILQMKNSIINKFKDAFIIAFRDGEKTDVRKAIAEFKKLENNKEKRIMMKYFTKEVKIGIAGLVALFMLIYGINYLKGINMFKPSSYYYVRYSNINGLAKSSPVFADGFRIGTVRDIYYDYTHPGNVTVEVEMDTEMRVPKGSTAELVTEMLGTVKMNLLLANNPRESYQVGDTIPGVLNNGLMEAVTQTLMPEMEKMLPRLDSILISLNQILADPNIPATLKSAQKTAANLEVATAQLNVLMKKDIPQLTGKLNTIGDNFITISDNLKGIDYASTFEKVDATMANLKNVTDKLSDKDNTIGLLLNDSALYRNLSTTGANAAALLEDLKSHPKRYVHFSLFGKKEK